MMDSLMKKVIRVVYAPVVVALKARQPLCKEGCGLTELDQGIAAQLSITNV